MLQSKVAVSGQESVPETTDGASAQTTAAFAEPANSTPSYKVYIVGEGETLYGICFKEYNNIRKLEEICRINSLTDENSIYAGQKLLLPEMFQKSEIFRSIQSYLHGLVVDFSCEMLYT